MHSSNRRNRGITGFHRATLPRARGGGLVVALHYGPKRRDHWAVRVQEGLPSFEALTKQSPLAHHLSLLLRQLGRQI